MQIKYKKLSYKSQKKTISFDFIVSTYCLSYFNFKINLKLNQMLYIRNKVLSSRNNSFFTNMKKIIRSAIKSSIFSEWRVLYSLKKPKARVRISNIFMLPGEFAIWCKLFLYIYYYLFIVLYDDSMCELYFLFSFCQLKIQWHDSWHH